MQEYLNGMGIQHDGLDHLAAGSAHLDAGPWVTGLQGLSSLVTTKPWPRAMVCTVWPRAMDCGLRNELARKVVPLGMRRVAICPMILLGSVKICGESFNTSASWAIKSSRVTGSSASMVRLATK